MKYSDRKYITLVTCMSLNHWISN